jgi:hypothetical protein
MTSVRPWQDSSLCFGEVPTLALRGSWGKSAHSGRLRCTAGFVKELLQRRPLMRRRLISVAITMLVGPWASAGWIQQGSKLVGSNVVGSSQQGIAVALSADGNTAVVGGHLDNGDTGATWIFTRSGGVWTQQGGKLVGTGATGSANQGRSVALSADGNTALVGGDGDNGGIGAAWVFTRSGGAWTQQGSKLVGSNAVGNSQQGIAVALSADGNTAIVGGHGDNSNTGAVWVFTCSGGVWTQQGGKLVGSGAAGHAYQGHAVALSGDGNTVLLGGLLDNNLKGAAWVFTRSGGVWTQQGGKLVGTGAEGDAEQGIAVALSSDGNTAMVGGFRDGNLTGAAWVFIRSGGVWTQQGPKLVGTGAVGTSYQGISVALSADGSIGVVGGYWDNGYAGATWAFTRSGGVWTQQGDKLFGTGAVGNADQGVAVALSADGGTAIVGGWLDNNEIGAAWVFVTASGCVAPSITAQPQSQTIASGQTATLSVTASGTAPLSYQWYRGSTGDTSHAVGSNSSSFSTPALTSTTGYWVRVSNACGPADSATATVIVGASATCLAQQGSKLVGVDAIGASWQGASVSVSADGNSAIVGGPHDNSNTGAAWAFARSGGVWTQQGSKLVGTGAVGAAHQGGSVAISADGSTAIIGGAYDDSDFGAAWVFTRSGSVWTQQGEKLVGTGADWGAMGLVSQGRSVAISADGNTAIVGGANDNSDLGAAWAFTRSGGVWTQQGSKLVGSGSVGVAQQGGSVAISADGATAIIGGWRDNAEAGAAWVFTRSGGVWTQQGGKLVGSGAVGAANQGASVAISANGATVVIGGWRDNSNTGAAWVFTRSGGVWTQQGGKLVANGAVGPAGQGSEVALSADGNTAIVGGDYDSSGVGAAWVFTRSGGVWLQQCSKMVGTDAVGWPRQGAAVAVSSDGSTAMVGGWGDSSSVGAAWVFVATGGCTPPSITVQPQSQTIANGQSATLGVAANGTTPFAYQWYQGSAGDTSTPVGSGSNSFTTPALDVATSYWVRVSNGCGQANSQTATITICTGPVITAQPQSQTIPTGQTATVAVAASGAALSYQWYQGTAGDTSLPVGSKASSYTTPALTTTTSYWVRISNWCGHVDSVTATIVVSPSQPNTYFIQQGNKLVGAGAVGIPYQGGSVAISADGNTVIVGGSNDNGGVGAAWVFTRSGVVWSQQGPKLVGPGAIGAARQGSSVAISADGNTVLIGGPYDNNKLGAAWVFTRSGGVWSPQGGKLVRTPGGIDAYYGGNVALSADGNNAMLGHSYVIDGTPSVYGIILVFTRSGGAWTPGPEFLPGQKCDCSTPQNWEGEGGFAVSLSADGNTALLGCPELRAGDTFGQGGAWLYSRSGGWWTPNTNAMWGVPGLFGRGWGTSQNQPVMQGLSVALSSDGTTALLGSPYERNLGAAWVFTYSGGSWGQNGVNLVGTGAMGSTSVDQGRDVALSGSGDIALSAGSGDDNYNGAVWVFTRSGGVWAQRGDKLVASGAVGAAAQGGSVALSTDGRTAVIGGPSDSSGIGAAWIFVAACTAPEIITSPQSQTIVTGHAATLGVAASGTSLSYQWYQGSSGNTSLPVGTNASTFTTPALTTAVSYWVRVSNACGQADSATATITVVPPVAITTPPTLPSGMFGVAYSHQFEANGGVTNGGGASVVEQAGSAPRLVAAAPGGGYTWRVKRGSPPGGVILSAQGLLAGTPTESGDFDFTVEAADSVGNTAEQDFSMHVDPCVSAAITTQPQSQTILRGQTATLTFNVSGTAPLSYRWYQGSTGDTSQPVGADSPSFTTPALTAATSYWVRVSNPCGGASSQAATITICDAPAITTQPQSTTILRGQTATMTADATGTAPLSYQWYQGSSGDTSQPVGADSPSFATPALTADATFWVRASSPCGHADSATAVVSVVDAVRRLNRHLRRAL